MTNVLKIVRTLIMWLSATFIYSTGAHYLTAPSDKAAACGLVLVVLALALFIFSIGLLIVDPDFFKEKKKDK